MVLFRMYGIYVVAFGLLASRHRCHGLPPW